MAYYLLLITHLFAKILIFDRNKLTLLPNYNVQHVLSHTEDNVLLNLHEHDELARSLPNREDICI